MSVLIVDPDIGADISVRQLFEDQGIDEPVIAGSVVQVEEFLQHGAETQAASNA